MMAYGACRKPLEIYTIPATRTVGVEVRAMRTKFASVLAVALSLGVVQAASAADMPTKAPIVRVPVAAPYDWSGFYLGAHFGYEWARVRLVAVTGQLNAITEALAQVGKKFSH